MLRPIVVLLLAGAAGACVRHRAASSPDVPTVACAAPLQPWVRTSLYTDQSNPKDPLDVRRVLRR